jgi:hypothetical protein
LSELSKVGRGVCTPFKVVGVSFAVEVAGGRHPSTQVVEDGGVEDILAEDMVLCFTLLICDRVRRGEERGEVGVWVALGVEGEIDVECHCDLLRGVRGC